MRQRSLFGEAGEQRARDTEALASVWDGARADQTLLGSVRLAEYGRLLVEGAITDTPSTRRRPKGKEGVRAEERAKEAALHEISGGSGKPGVRRKAWIGARKKSCAGARRAGDGGAGGMVLVVGSGGGDQGQFLGEEEPTGVAARGQEESASAGVGAATPTGVRPQEGRRRRGAGVPRTKMSGEGMGRGWDQAARSAAQACQGRRRARPLPARGWPPLSAQAWR